MRTILMYPDSEYFSGIIDDFNNSMKDEGFLELVVEHGEIHSVLPDFEKKLKMSLDRGVPPAPRIGEFMEEYYSIAPDDILLDVELALDEHPISVSKEHVLIPKEYCIALAKIYNINRHTWTEIASIFGEAEHRLKDIMYRLQAKGLVNKKGPGGTFIKRIPIDPNLFFDIKLKNRLRTPRDIHIDDEPETIDSTLTDLPKGLESDPNLFFDIKMKNRLRTSRDIDDEPELPKGLESPKLEDLLADMADTEIAEEISTHHKELLIEVLHRLIC